MADVSKANMTVLTGSPDDTAAISKIVMTVVLRPDAGGVGTAAGQGHVFAQELR